MAPNEGRRRANSHGHFCGVGQSFSPTRIGFTSPVRGATGNKLHRKYHSIRYFDIPQTGEPILRLSGLWLRPVGRGTYGFPMLAMSALGDCRLAALFNSNAASNRELLTGLSRSVFGFSGFRANQLAVCEAGVDRNVRLSRIIAVGCPLRPANSRLFGAQRYTSCHAARCHLARAQS
jgi:hypothetical protein